MTQKLKCRSKSSDRQTNGQMDRQTRQPPPPPLNWTPVNPQSTPYLNRSAHSVGKSQKFDLSCGTFWVRCTSISRIRTVAGLPVNAYLSMCMCVVVCVWCCVFVEFKHFPNFAAASKSQKFSQQQQNLAPKIKRVYCCRTQNTTRELCTGWEAMEAGWLARQPLPLAA